LPCPVPEYPRQYLIKDDAHVFTTGTPLNLPEELLVRSDGVAHPRLPPSHRASCRA
jgi:hypothetical protein